MSMKSILSEYLNNFNTIRIQLKSIPDNIVIKYNRPLKLVISNECLVKVKGSDGIKLKERPNRYGFKFWNVRRS